MLQEMESAWEGEPPVLDADAEGVVDAERDILEPEPEPEPESGPGLDSAGDSSGRATTVQLQTITPVVDEPWATGFLLFGCAAVLCVTAAAIGWRRYSERPKPPLSLSREQKKDLVRRAAQAGGLTAVGSIRRHELRMAEEQGRQQQQRRQRHEQKTTEEDCVVEVENPLGLH